MNKKILFVTGTRADYGKLEPLAYAAKENGYSVSLFITGMHMMKLYGETKNEVRRFPADYFFEFVNQREGDSQESILSKTISGFSDFVHEFSPDLVVIHGDRIEALAASVVCAIKYIRSAHIEGGEVSGNIDESLRHCNTKLCTSHFVSSEVAKSRLVAMGEKTTSIYVIGSPELDVHKKDSGITIEQVMQRYEIPFTNYGIIIFHPVTSEINEIRDQAEALFSAAEKSGKQFVVIAPNNDPGSREVFEVLNKLPADRFRILPSMRFLYFSELLKNSSLIIGNSSVGVREAPFLGISSIDIGSRQSNRSDCESIRNYSAYDCQKILDAISSGWGVRHKSSGSFGEGLAAIKFSEIIRGNDFWDIPVQKNYV
jgi:UDP-N-acetylglucosamine 2-epimerase (hydrolysing)